MFRHGGKEADGAVDIGTVILQRNFSRLPNCLIDQSIDCFSVLGDKSSGVLMHPRIWRTYLQRSKVDDVVYIRVVLEDSIKSPGLSDIHIVELRAFAADQFNAVDGFLRGIAKIVCNDYFVVGFEQCKGCEGANVASPT